METDGAYLYNMCIYLYCIYHILGIYIKYVRELEHLNYTHYLYINVKYIVLYNHRPYIYIKRC